MQVQRLSSRGGLTLMEILIATAVLSIGILGVISTFTFGTTATKTGKMTSEATNLARMVVEHVRLNTTSIGGVGIFPSPPPPSTPLAAGLEDSETDRRPLDAPPFDTAGLPPGTPYLRNVQITYPSPGIAQIRVRVFWRDKRKENVVELFALQSDPG